ncbi:alpha/beta hydrolase [Planococcus sp. APC 4015]|nr:alpha/beta hydrolase [Planococcus sp. APC 4015]
MSDHTYRTLDVAVTGGDLRVAVWDPVGDPTDDVLLIHGVTSSHLAFPFVVEGLPGIRVVAPDLRGRGASNALTGPAGLRAHADDLAAALDALGIDKTLVVGHSMGAFVAVVFAHRHPERVSRLLLVDGGLPLDVPSGLDADELIARVLGPTGARLSMRFADVGEYLAFWRDHPAFRRDWSPELEHYLAYDLVPDGSALRPATSYATTAEDTVDMNTGDTLPSALDALTHPTALVTTSRGLQDEAPGLYAPQHLASILERHSDVRHERLDGFNHYTVVLSRDGGAAVASRIERELAATRGGG